jgi:hypothetical protein
MTVFLVVEGQTEEAFVPILRDFVHTRTPPGQRLRIKTHRYEGRIPQRRLKADVERLLNEGDAVVALTDVYTGTGEFTDAEDAKRQMREWVGSNPKFYPHAAQYEFEAWLLPFWEKIRRLSGSNRVAPRQNPENVNHEHPPSHYIKEAFRTGGDRRYVKPRDARRILDGQDLSVAAARCPELKALLNTLLTLAGADLLN